MFSCKIGETFKNTYFEEYLRTTAFELKKPRRVFWPLSNICDKYFVKTFNG